MKNIFFVAYVVLLVLLSVISVLTTLANDTQLILVIEVFVDLVFIFGCIVYLLSKHVKFWLVVFVPAAIGEFFLLYSDKNTTVMLMVIWIIFLFPAFYLNWMVAKSVVKVN